MDYIVEAFCEHHEGYLSRNFFDWLCGYEVLRTTSRLAHGFDSIWLTEDLTVYVICLSHREQLGM